MKNVEIFRTTNGRYRAIATNQWSWPAFLFTYLWVIWYDVWKLGCFWVLTGVTLTIAGIALFLHDRLALEASTVTTTFWVLYVANALILGIAGNTFRSETVRSRGYSHVHSLSAPSPREALNVYVKSLEADDRAPQLKVVAWTAPAPQISEEIRSIAERERTRSPDRNDPSRPHADAPQI